MTLAKTGLSTTADISVDYATENGVDIHPHRHQLFTDFPVRDPPSREDTLGHDPDALLQLKFSTAAALWLSIRKPYLKARTFYMYGHHIKQLNKAFAELPIGKMHIGDLRKYQLARLGNTDKLWARAAGPSLIRHEMSVVEMVLKRAGVWKQRFALHYEPMPLPKVKPQKVMTDQQEEMLFQIANSNPDWELACVVAGITNNTSAAGTELRHLKFENLYLDNPYPTFLIPAEFCKNDNRGRRIFINETAMEYFKRAVAMANKKGSHRPEHYLFPKRVVRGLYDPYKPASSSWLRNQFHELREAAGLPWLTPHCLRHQIITRLFEEGHSEQDIQSITGQLSRQALKMYSHNRIERQRSVLQTIDPARRIKQRPGPERTRLGVVHQMVAN